MSATSTHRSSILPNEPEISPDNDEFAIEPDLAQTLATQAFVYEICEKQDKGIKREFHNTRQYTERCFNSLNVWKDSLDEQVRIQNIKLDNILQQSRNSRVESAWDNVQPLQMMDGSIPKDFPMQFHKFARLDDSERVNSLVASLKFYDIDSWGRWGLQETLDNIEENPVLHTSLEDAAKKHPGSALLALSSFLGISKDKLERMRHVAQRQMSGSESKKHVNRTEDLREDQLGYRNRPFSIDVPRVVDTAAPDFPISHLHGSFHNLPGNQAAATQKQDSSSGSSSHGSSLKQSSSKKSPSKKSSPKKSSSKQTPPTLKKGPRKESPGKIIVSRSITPISEDKGFQDRQEPSIVPETVYRQSPPARLETSGEARIREEAWATLFQRVPRFPNRSESSTVPE